MGEDVSNAVLKERLDVVVQNTADIKAAIEKIDGRVDVVEIANVKIDGKADAAHRRLDDHVKRLDTLEVAVRNLSDAVQPLVWTSRLIAFVGTAVGVSIIALIWSLITGQASVTFAP